MKIYQNFFGLSLLASLFFLNKKRLKLFEIVKNPWDKKLYDLVLQSQKNIKISSPYISKEICKNIFKHKNSQTKIQLITDFKINNLINNSLDILALEEFIINNSLVKSYPSLHAKIYIFDDEKFVISSSNLTFGGLVKNFEYGIFSNDKDFSQNVVNDFNQAFADEKTFDINGDNISQAKQIIKNALENSEIDLKFIEKEKNYLNSISSQSIIESLSGWKKEVFIVLNQNKNQFFNLEEIYKYNNYFEKIYPENKFIKDKIRQTLQYLRNAGLIEFMADGKYKKLWKFS
jgi:phosphatidylserine/phosphatidylglycerophosphate/cardiolipin synthase-like enzyme